MGKFDRYFLSQLTVFFGFIAAVLVLVYWVNRAVRLFDWLIASGQSAAVFLEFTALTLPNVIRLVLPIAGFVAVLYTANRMTSESELVVVQANGFSPFRLARPVPVFGAMVAFLMMLIVHFALPASHSRLADRRLEVSEDMTAQLLVEGRFVHPSDGMTIFIGDITGSGRLKDVYLRDSRSDAQHLTYTATEALLVRTETGPRLVLYNGMVQALNLPDRRLSLTRFDDFALDLNMLISGPGGDGTAKRTWRDASTLELIFGNQDFARSIGASLRRIRVEGHNRIAEPIFAFIAPLLAFSVMVQGGHNRFGKRWQIALAVVLMVLLYVLDSAFEDLALTRRNRWPYIYVAPLVGGVGALLLLWLAANPGILRRRKRAVA